MCGIAGIFNLPDAFNRVKTALALLHNRGREGFGISDFHEIQLHHDLTKFFPLKGKNIVGHALHAVVDLVPQPIKAKGLLIANCEIYNWGRIAHTYNLPSRNDAELLLKFLDQFGISKIEELDGVYAFAYWLDNKVILARDIVGEKPLWYVLTSEGLAFASEKKILEKLGYIDIQELNPRTILEYDITKNRLKSINRPFFTYLPEHTSSYSELKQKTKELLERAIEKRVPQKKFGLLFSGGIDSTFLAQYFKKKGYDVTCYTAALESMTTIPADLEQAKKVATELKLPLKIRTIREEEIPQYLRKIVPLIEDSNVVKVGVALTFYLACELAKLDGCKVIFSGLGSEEIFAGYERHKHSANINQECISGLLKMYERDLYRDDVITMDNNLELRLPFLDRDLIEYALKIPGNYKITSEDVTKNILRDIAVERGIPQEIAFRKKMAAQYGSRLDNALGKLAKKNGFPSKSAYLRTFYPSHNLKLGVLFSSGKDSTSAALIMRQQNYELACLIHLRSKNKDSYMFQTAGTELIELQAEAMDLPLLIQETSGEKETELTDLKEVLRKAKEQYKITGLITGALFSTYQRDRIEKICDALGLKIFSPLWHKSQEQHMREVVANNIEAVIVAVAAEGLDKSWLGRKIDEKMIEELVVLHKKIGLNVSGEGGEFESLVLDSPLFKKKIDITKSEIKIDSPHSGRLIIKGARLINKYV